MKKLAILLGSIIVLFVLLLYFYPTKERDSDKFAEVRSFEECIADGNPVMESYPRQCRDKSGKTFIEDIGNELEKTDLIRISSPRPNAIVESPLVVEGEARGFWFFEASFPAELIDSNGNNIPLEPGYIMTSHEWMTEDFVPFSGTITFTLPSTKTGTLILKKDNPSGLPEHDDELIVPVRFR